MRCCCFMFLIFYYLLMIVNVMVRVMKRMDDRLKLNTTFNMKSTWSRWVHVYANVTSQCGRRTCGRLNVDLIIMEWNLILYGASGGSKYIIVFSNLWIFRHPEFSLRVQLPPHMSEKTAKWFVTVWGHCGRIIRVRTHLKTGSGSGSSEPPLTLLWTSKPPLKFLWTSSELSLNP